MMLWWARGGSCRAPHRAGRRPSSTARYRCGFWIARRQGPAIRRSPDPIPEARPQGLGRSCRAPRTIDQLDITRDTPILAMGGGSVGDVAGLAASLFKRGCPIVHLPTTLLAQADSAIGGKTAIDWQGRKNLIVTFHQPSLVVADPAFLETLDQRQLRAGYAEIVKYGLIDDPAFFTWCEAHGAALIAGDHALRRTAIEHCARAKLRLVADDIEDRRGARALLNLGHSFAHAIETASGLGTVLHGEAVAIGLCLAFGFSAELGLCPAEDGVRVRTHLASVGLPTRLADAGLAGAGDSLLDAIKSDKKAGAEGISLTWCAESAARGRTRDRLSAPCHIPD